MAILILFAASLLGGFVFPWWWPAMAAYIVGFLLPRRAGIAFLSGFAGTAPAWVGLAAFLDLRNHHGLSDRVAAVFHLPSGLYLLAATGLMGGCIGGLAAWAGYALRAYVKPPFSETAAEAAVAEAAGTAAGAGAGTAARPPAGPA
ncbi:MAG: hypothetical protein ABI036_04875 [Fibrobacteria bacterium]